MHCLLAGARRAVKPLQHNNYVKGDLDPRRVFVLSTSGGHYELLTRGIFKGHFAGDGSFFLGSAVEAGWCRKDSISCVTLFHGWEYPVSCPPL